MELTYELIVRDAEDGEVLHRISTFSLESLEEGIGRFERHQLPKYV